MADHAESAPSPHDVGLQFVEKYYKLLSTPAKLFHMYGATSSVTYGIEGSNPVVLQGVEHIKSFFDTRSPETAVLTAFNCQDSLQGGVVVSCVGKLSRNNKKFTQVFYLARKSTTSVAYYCLNDVLWELLDAPTAPTPSAAPAPAPAPKVVPEETKAVDGPATRKAAPTPSAATAPAPKAASPKASPKKMREAPAPAPAPPPAAPKSYAAAAAASKNTPPPAAPTKSPVPPATPVVKEAPAPAPSAPTSAGRKPAPGSGVNPAVAYVTNIPPQVSQEVLTQVFQKYGPVQNVTVRQMREKDDWYAFVDFKTKEACDAAIADTDKPQLALGHVKVEPARPKPMRGRRGGVADRGGRGGRGGGAGGDASNGSGDGGRGRGGERGRGGRGGPRGGGRGRGAGAGSAAPGTV